VLSAKAKRRQEKGMDRAEAVMDKKETKVEKSKGRARTVQERAKAWEELNKKMALKKAEAQALKDLQAEEEEIEDMEEDVRVEEDAPMIPVGEMAQSMWAPKVVPESIPLPQDEEEEL
jgi:hypothetical protein